jgi:hypothetical protein
MRERDMPKRKKPDAAERIANGVYPEGTMTDSMLVHALASAIRRAISAAVRADRGVEVKYE